MKEILRKIVPLRFRIWFSRFRKNRIIKKMFLYDYDRYSHFANTIDSEEGLLAKISLCCHAIEKGFTMPDFRCGFGVTKLKELLPMCRQFIRKYGKQSVQFRKIIQVIYEYRLCHEQHGCAMPDDVAGEINALLKEFPDVKSTSVQIDAERTTYFSHVEAPFPEFSKSRHSVRNFSEEPVPMEKIRNAIRLAQLAPSACNRQSVRVIVVTDKEKIAKVFSVHGGNRGFGHTVNKLILLAGYLPGYNGEIERNWLYLDVGIFAMNLAYALHYYQIGAVILNWDMRKCSNEVIYPLLDIPQDWTVSLIIAVGNLPEHFKVCTSPKKAIEDIILER